MGGYMTPATSPVASIFGSNQKPDLTSFDAVNQYVTGLDNQYGHNGDIGDIGSIFGNNTLQTLGGGLDIFKNLFGMYMSNKGMKAGINSMNNQAIAYNNNAINQQNFTNGVIDAFGSGQQRTNNQMARQFS